MSIFSVIQCCNCGANFLCGNPLGLKLEIRMESGDFGAKLPTGWDSSGSRLGISICSEEVSDAVTEELGERES